MILDQGFEQEKKKEMLNDPTQSFRAFHSHTAKSFLHYTSLTVLGGLYVAIYNIICETSAICIEEFIEKINSSIQK